MLYWGSKGIQRDLRQAAVYYRLAAEHMDPSALYDYGLVLLKVGAIGPIFLYRLQSKFNHAIIL